MGMSEETKKTLANLFDTLSKRDRVEFSKAMEEVYAERRNETLVLEKVAVLEKFVEDVQQANGILQLKLGELEIQVEDLKMQRDGLVLALDSIVRTVYALRLTEVGIVLPVDEEQFAKLDQEREELERQDHEFTNAAAKAVFEDIEMREEYDFTDAVPVKRPPNLKRTKKP